VIRLLDTNTCIYFLNETSEKVIAQFQKLTPSQIKLSSITVAELFYGVEKSKSVKKNRIIVENFISAFDIIPFDFECSKIYAKTRALLELAGTPVGPMDLLIAAISLTHNFTLVTNNTKEFQRVKNLKLENWI
jgi:tRNA(fMet)-specific endonuclease VapC